jgi:hypothetical protein
VGIKNKLSNKIEFRYLLQLCLGYGKMTTIPTPLVGTFFKILAYSAEIALHVGYKRPS